MESLGIKFPFKETYDGGIIGVTQTDVQKIKSNLLAFLVLKRGQRPMHNSLYSPIYDYIMEVWDEMTETSLSDDLRQKITEFFPEIAVVLKQQAVGFLRGSGRLQHTHMCPTADVDETIGVLLVKVVQNGRGWVNVAGRFGKFIPFA